MEAQLLTESTEFVNIKYFQWWIEYISKSTWVVLHIDDKIDAPAMINVNNLQRPVVTLNISKMKEKFNYTDSQIVLDIAHEMWHLKEETEMRATKQWWEYYENTIKPFFENAWFKGQAYFHLFNGLRDLRVDDRVVSSEVMPIFRWDLENLYSNKLFKATNYIGTQEDDWNWNIITKWKLPLHLQFLNALMREYRIKDVECIVDPKVRRLLRRLNNNKTIDLVTKWPLQERFQNILDYVLPIYDELLDEDIKNHEYENQNQPNQSGEQWQWSGQQSGNPSPSSSQNKSTGKSPENKPEQPSDSDNKPEQSNDSGNQPKSTSSQQPKQENWSPDQDDKNKGDDKGQWWDENKENKDFNPFDYLYTKEEENRPHMIHDSVDQNDIDKLKESITETIKENSRPKTQQEIDLENKAKKILWDKWKDDKNEIKRLIDLLKKYNDFRKDLEKLKDPDTWKSLMEELAEIFELIKSKRLRPEYEPKWPVDIEDGDDLYGPSIADWMAQIEAWESEILMFEKDVVRHIEEEHVGDFEVTLISDGSGSMAEQEKRKYQKMATLLILESLKYLHDRLEWEINDLSVPLNFLTQAMMFMGRTKQKWFRSESRNPSEYIRHIKPLWKSLNDKERLEAYETLNICDGWNTNDNDWLKNVYLEVMNKWTAYKESIKSWKLVKIVIVTTDWDTSFSDEQRLYLNLLRWLWVIVYGIWIGSGCDSIETSYFGENKKLWYWVKCKNIADLPKCVKNLLMPHLLKV